MTVYQITGQSISSAFIGVTSAVISGEKGLSL